mmetsp:Transcript_1888/g.5713  ORF Transcript_1888/g.5713 Transcript_1888/m.5713 type:complete len:143 (+) Transcript_1888:2662-3090(+)
MRSSHAQTNRERERKRESSQKLEDKRGRLSIEDALVFPFDAQGGRLRGSVLPPLVERLAFCRLEKRTLFAGDARWGPRREKEEETTSFRSALITGGPPPRRRTHHQVFSSPMEETDLERAMLSTTMETTRTTTRITPTLWRL